MPISTAPRFPRTLLASLSPRTLLLALAAALGLLLGSSPAWAGSGRISVSNDRGETILVQVDRHDQGQVAARSRTVLSVHPGRHEVVLRSRSGQVLLRTVEDVRPGGSSSVRLAAIEAPLRVLNPLDRTVRVMVDGEPRATLLPYASRSLTLELGRHSLALVLDGRSIVSEGVAVTTDRQQTWAPRPAMIGDLVVNNPLPIPVTLTCSRGLSRTLPAHGTTTYGGLSQGSFALTVRRAGGGELLGQLRPSVRAFDTVAVAVQPPTTGILAVTSQQRRGIARVYVDGRFLTSIGPASTERLELSPGQHEVVIRHGEGQVLDRRTVRIDRYDVAAIEIKPGPDHQRPGDAYSFSDRDDGYLASSSSCSMR